MIYAAIDVGSNTIRLLIGTVRGSRFLRVFAKQNITGLARGLRNTGRLSYESMERSLSALKDFAVEAAGYGAPHVRAVGTCALREARNSREFLDLALSETGINIEVISGAEEAMLTAKGVLSGFDVLSGRILIIDIGGGSTEWIIYNSGEPSQNLTCGTVQTGVVTLHERFISSDPPSAGDISALTDEINSAFGTGTGGIKNDAAMFSRLIGTGGTITTLAAIDLGLREYDYETVHGHYMSIRRLRKIKDNLFSLTFRERKNIPGLEPERADLIIPGILLTIRLLELFGFQGITVSDLGLLEGVIKGVSDEEGI